MATLASAIEQRSDKKPSKRAPAYNALLLFTFLYYARPEDLIPGLNSIPLEKIIGGVALLALISTLVSGQVKRKFPLELKLLLLLFVHLTISIPFAYWPGGAFVHVFERFSKGVIVAFLVTLIIDNVAQLRRLFWVQAGAMVITTISSILIHHTDKGRLVGALGGIFENPNDLAINIAINWPLCMAFLLLGRGMSKKAIWTVGLLSMMAAVVLTYSRAGLLALVVAIVICLWKFGIRGGRSYLVVAAVFLGVAGMGVVIGTPHYLARVESIFGSGVEGSLDNGSREARLQLLKYSVEEAIHHPIFGIGAGNFGAATGTWRAAHNSYTEFAAEGGFPALILYLAILYLAHRNLKKTRFLPAYRDPEIQVFTNALWASLMAFLVGSTFASFEYHLFPYFMVAYTSVLYRLSSQKPQGEQGREPDRGNVWKRYRGEINYGNSETTKRG